MYTRQRGDAQSKYDKAHTKSVLLKLNKKTDADILGKLEQVPNKQGYIKELVRNDLRQQGRRMLQICVHTYDAVSLRVIYACDHGCFVTEVACKMNHAHLRIYFRQLVQDLLAPIRTPIIYK